MKNKEDLQLIEVLTNELMIDFQEKRHEERVQAARCIAKIQLENKTQFDKTRKQPHLYAVGDLVAIQRVKHDKGAKFRSTFVGPYEITRTMRNDRYQIHKIGFGEGPNDTSVPADRMKPCAQDIDSDEEE